jgi:hypothetical protein
VVLVVPAAVAAEAVELQVIVEVLTVAALVQ